MVKMFQLSKFCCVACRSFIRNHDASDRTFNSNIKRRWQWWCNYTLYTYKYITNFNTFNVHRRCIRLWMWSVLNTFFIGETFNYLPKSIIFIAKYNIHQNIDKRVVIFLQLICLLHISYVNKTVFFFYFSTTKLFQIIKKKQQIFAFSLFNSPFARQSNLTAKHSNNVFLVSCSKPPSCSNVSKHWCIESARAASIL